MLVAGILDARALTVVVVDHGCGKYFLMLTEEGRQYTVLFALTSFTAQLSTASLPKPAVVSLLTRLLSPSRAHRLFMWSIAIASKVIAAGSIVIFWAWCRLLKKNWDLSID